MPMLMVARSLLLVPTTTEGILLRHVRGLEKWGLCVSMSDKIIVKGFVYSSQQNGVVLGTEGICNCLGVGCHGGVESKIEVIYET